MKRSDRRAFTLVEILACMTIVVALTALTASVYRMALTRGKLGEELSQLRQLAMAANLYHDQHDAWPSNTTALVNMGTVPTALCKSPRDRYREGWANRYLRGLSQEQTSYARMVAPFPNTYICFSDIRMQRRDALDRILAEQSNPGLFVSLIESTNMWPNANPTGPFEGKYRRVLLDGSVVVRRHQAFAGLDAQGKPVKMMSDDTWFFDPDERWIKELLTTQ